MPVLPATNTVSFCIKHEVSMLDTVMMTNTGVLTSVIVNITNELECDSQAESFKNLSEQASRYLPISSE